MLSIRDTVELELLELDYPVEVIEAAGMVTDWIWQVLAESIGLDPDTKGEVDATAPG